MNIMGVRLPSMSFFYRWNSAMPPKGKSGHGKIIPSLPADVKARPVCQVCGPAWSGRERSPP
jgi:hypothetical protein